MKITQLGFLKPGLTALAVTALVLSGGCASADDERAADAGASGSAAASGSPSAASDCPLVNAPDPGNSKAPANTPVSKGAPKVEKKSSYKVAFSQITSDNPFRLAETQSMKTEAEKRGWKITVTDAGGKEDKQIQDMKTLISQKPDAIFLAPNTEKGLAPVVKQAADAGIAVFLVDRTVDPSIAKPGEDFVTTIASDFVQEGKRAAIQLAKATGGKANIIELEGTTGSSPAIDRKKGFADTIAVCKEMKVVVSQDADFSREKGQSVAETLLQSQGSANAIYAHNDEMALGAINALKAAGKTPGKDVLLVSIDGNKDAVTAVSEGELVASVECNPRFGPVAYDALEAYAAGKSVPIKIVSTDRLFDSKNAAQNIEQAY
ncbi:MAG TPA: ABC transporter substrate-binding protein [Propionibacteriaceae bacterium]